MITNPKIRPRRWRGLSVIFWPPWESPIPTPKETMPNPADDANPRRPRGGWRRPLRGLLSRIGLGQSARAAAQGHAQSQAGADLMDQAEAFQSLSVADVMTPRADITAVELSASFEVLVAAFA